VRGRGYRGSIAGMVSFSQLLNGSCCASLSVTVGFRLGDFLGLSSNACLFNFLNAKNSAREINFPVFGFL
jgi:hypothetical protein